MLTGDTKTDLAELRRLAKHEWDTAARLAGVSSAGVGHAIGAARRYERMARELEARS